MIACGKFLTFDGRENLPNVFIFIYQSIRYSVFVPSLIKPQTIFSRNINQTSLLRWCRMCNSRAFKIQAIKICDGILLLHKNIEFCDSKQGQVLIQTTSISFFFCLKMQRTIQYHFLSTWSSLEIQLRVDQFSVICTPVLDSKFLKKNNKKKNTRD